MTSSLTVRERVLIFAFWTGVALISAVNRLLDAPGFIRIMSPAGPVALAFVEAWAWAAVTPFVFRLSSRNPLERSTLWWRIPLLVAIGVALSIGIYVFIDIARDLLIEVPRRRRQLSTFEELARFRFINQLVFYVAVLAVGYAREYFLRDRDREAQAAALKAQLAEARLSALRMQLNPHFLFNTLNAVSALVERDPAGVRKMIARLSELLRHTTDSTARDLVPLVDELGFVRRYIEIMEIRFQGQLRASIDADAELLDIPVPNLILQPLVENAIEHGTSRVSQAGAISVTARMDDRSLVLRVRDNGPGIGRDVEQGVGIANTRARLSQLYGDRARFTLSSHPEGGALAEIVITDPRPRR